MIDWQQRLGERNGNAKLNAEQVDKIRRSPLASRVLAEVYGVTPRTIQGIRAGRTWKVPA